MEKNNKIRRNPKPMSLETLIYEIKSLENDKIIPFEEFKQKSFENIRRYYFPMVNIKTIHKALIKIQDEKAGNIGASTITTISRIYKNDKIIIKRVDETF